jgi:hypothetical protein
MIKVIKIIKDENEGRIKVYFEKGKKEGSFVYSFFGNEIEEKGIDDCKYDEGDGEDICQEIQEWVNKNIEARITIRILTEKEKVVKSI